MAFPGNIYAPPGVYTRTLFENPTQGLLEGLKIPVYIGTGSEILTQNALELVRGSSSSVDQQVVQEDLDGRLVTAISDAGDTTLGDFDGTIRLVQVRNYPIVSGDGTGTTSTDTSDVSVTVNGVPTVVLSMVAASGILELSTTPQPGDDVRVTYFFNRTDTQITDDVSDQITSGSAVLYGAIGESYEIDAGVNDEMILTVDDEDEITVTLSEGTRTASQIASAINSAASTTTLVASTTTNNFGETVVVLTADRNILVGSGSSNSTLGFSAGDNTARNKVFTTFNGPIVDGNNGGVTTTDTADVTVKVDNVQVIPTAVDGLSRQVTLPFAPEDGATVTIQYYFNTWQDTFDYLAHTNITDITLAGVTPDRSDFIDKTDFILQNDRIVWGTAVTISSGEHTTGTTFFNDSQISTTMVDTRGYLEECSAVVDTSVSPSVESRLEFQLPFVPTTGNGRSSPLGTSLFQTVSNARIDLPTNRPDLVTAYWGFGIQDALERGPVDVVSVDSSNSTITLASPVPVGATVYATFYYNTLQDQEHTLEVLTAGAAGVGTYSITDESGNSLYTPVFGTKSTGLSTITVQFPSGSERSPDVRFESPLVQTNFTGAVEEDVTVTFSSLDGTLAKFTVPGAGPYEIISSASDHARIDVDGSTLASGSTGLDLTAINGIADLGFAASMVGDEISYDADTGFTTYDIDSTNKEVNLTIDGVLIQAIANESTTGTLADYVTAINRAATGETGTAAGGAASSITLVASSSDVDDYYVGWTVYLTNDSPVGTLGLSATVTAYDGTTKVATVDSPWATAPDATTTYLVIDPDTRPKYAAATRFLSTTTITASEYDELVFHYTGDVSTTSGDLTATIAAASYSSAATLATAVESAMTTAISALGAAFDGLAVSVEANSNGQLVFALTKAYGDVSGYLEFITHGTAASDFAVLAGVDTDTATAGGQTKLVDGPVARRFTIPGDNTSGLLHDRLVLRNRLVPGDSSTPGVQVASQTEIIVEGSNGDSQTGLTVNDRAEGGLTATVEPASILSDIGFADGQVASGTYTDSRDGQPVVTFYASGGTTAQNNVFKFTMDGTPVTVEFTDATGTAISSGGSADVPLGPAGTSNTIINQIATAMATAGLASTASAVLTAGLIRQEGAGFRLTSGEFSTASSVVIGTASANTPFNLVDGETADRTLVPPDVLASCLMAHSAASISGVLNSWTTPTTTYFADEALASVETNNTGAVFLFVQSQGDAGLGTTSIITWEDVTVDSVLLPTTGLGVSDGDSASGEAGVSGFYVTSSDTVDGSGTVNTSLLNSGDGQDGTVGQTYRDLVTGLTFTILEREGGTNYPDGSSFTFVVRTEVTTDSNNPVNTIPGVELLVTNTKGIGTGDTALVETFERGGQEPAIGDVYYVSYEYTKQDFSTQLYTKFAAIEAAYGDLSPDHPVTLAAFLSITNGAVLLGIKQVQKDTDANGDGVNDTASTMAFRDAVDELEGALRGGILPDILVPLKGDDQDFFEYITRHADLQSDIRQQAERTIMGGFSAGTEPRTAGDWAQAIQRDRLRLVYPDIATMTFDRADGTTSQTLVEGFMLASALSGSIVSPNVDVATPWTGRRLFGFDQLERILDAVEQNQVAVRGITVLEDRPPVIRVRQGLTTNMSNVLTKTPTIILIVDETQRQTRLTLERFVGIKFLPGILSQIEGQLSNTLKLLVEANILAAYTGVSASVAADDPTVAEVEAWIQPIFPLLYVIVQFNLRTNL